MEQELMERELLEHLQKMESSYTSTSVVNVSSMQGNLPHRSTSSPEAHDDGAEQENRAQSMLRGMMSPSEGSSDTPTPGPWRKEKAAVDKIMSSAAETDDSQPSGTYVPVQQLSFPDMYDDEWVSSTRVGGFNFRSQTKSKPRPTNVPALKLSNIQSNTYSWRTVPAGFPTALGSNRGRCWTDSTRNSPIKHRRPSLYTQSKSARQLAGQWPDLQETLTQMVSMKGRVRKHTVSTKLSQDAAFKSLIATEEIEHDQSLQKIESLVKDPWIRHYIHPYRDVFESTTGRMHYASNIMGVSGIISSATPRDRYFGDLTKTKHIARSVGLLREIQGPSAPVGVKGLEESNLVSSRRLKPSFTQYSKYTTDSGLYNSKFSPASSRTSLFSKRSSSSPTLKRAYEQGEVIKQPADLLLDAVNFVWFLTLKEGRKKLRELFLSHGTHSNQLSHRTHSNQLSHGTHSNQNSKEAVVSERDTTLTVTGFLELLVEINVLSRDGPTPQQTPQTDASGPKTSVVNDGMLTRAEVFDVIRNLCSAKMEKGNQGSLTWSVFRSCIDEMARTVVLKWLHSRTPAEAKGKLYQVPPSFYSEAQATDMNRVSNRFGGSALNKGYLRKPAPLYGTPRHVLDKKAANSALNDSPIRLFV